MRSLLLAAAVMAVTMPLAHADDYAGGAIKSMDTAKGEVLTDANGMTLYTFDKDAKNTSNCYDECAQKWPPLMAAADAAADGKYSQIARKDGSRETSPGMAWAASGTSPKSSRCRSSWTRSRTACRRCGAMPAP